MNIQAHSLVQQKAKYDSATKYRKKIQLILLSANNSRSSGCRGNQVAIFKQFALECSKWMGNILSEKNSCYCSKNNMFSECNLSD